MSAEQLQGPLQGEKKGGGSAPTEASDTLRSVQTAQLVDLISEGEIKGLVNGLKSVYLDGVPIENQDGSRNFEGVRFGFVPGTQAQGPLEGIDTVQAERAVGTDVKNHTPVTQTILNPSVDTVRVTIAVPALTHMDTGSGDLNGSEFVYAIDIQSSGGGFVERWRETISGKTTSTYKRAVRLALTGEAPWDIRVRRISADSTSAAITNAFQWDSLTEIQSVQLRYPNSAVAGLQVSARQFSRIPNRAYDVLGLCVRVPSNYNPVTGAYDGIWDGTFKIAWTNNPAWVFFDLATHPRYGGGRYIKDYHLDKWTLYEIGRYCDQRVPDGYGGTEPRFSCNLYLQTEVQARQALQDLASLMRCLTYWGASQVAVVQDSPADARFLFTNANIVGEFSYETVSAKTRHSVWTVYYNDLSQLGRRTPAVYIDKELVRKIGMVPDTLSPIGCTSRGQAIRLARWAALSERLGRTIKFRAGPDCVAVWPGQVFKVSDRRKAGKRLGGRVSAATTTVVTLDAPVTIAAGETYELEVMLPDPAARLGYKTEKRQVITGPGETRTLTVAAPFSQAPRAAAVWVLQPSSIQPTWWRMLARKDVDGTNEYEVVAIEHDPGKFEAIDQAVPLPPRPTSGISVKAPQVAEIALTETPYMDGPLPRIRVTASWPEPAQGLRYRVSWRLNTGPWTSLPETSANAVDVDGLQPGLFEVRVQTVNAIGREGAPVPAQLQLAGKTTPASDVTGVAIGRNAAGWLLTWEAPPDADWSATEWRRGGAGFEQGALLFYGRALQAQIGWLPAGNNVLRAVHWAAFRRSAQPSSLPVQIQSPGSPTITEVRQTVRACELRLADATTTQPLHAVHLRVGVAGSAFADATPFPDIPGGARSVTVVLPKGNCRLFTQAEDAYGNLGPIAEYDLTVVGYSANEILNELGGSLTEDLLSAQLRTKINKIDQVGAAVTQEVETRTSITDGLRAQYTLKAQVQRQDGSIVFGGIGLAATASGNVAQSHLIMMADRLTFVPSGDLNANPVPLLTTQLVGGQQQVVIRAALIGDLTITNSMLAGSIKADKIDTRGLTIKDDSGRVIFGAGIGIDQSVLPDSAVRNLIDLSWWRKGGTIPWVKNGAGEENTMYATSDVGGVGPRGASDIVMYAREAIGDGAAGGGWDAPNTLNLDPTKTYRFAIPIKKRDGAGGSAYWGAQANTACTINTTSPHENPYFAVLNRDFMLPDRWYLFVGYVFPYGSTGNTDAGAGIYDCKTGTLISGGWNLCHAAGGVKGHRAYQYYAAAGSTQLFGRPMVNLVDGTEPPLREFFESSAVLNSGLSPGQNLIPNSDQTLAMTMGWYGYPGTSFDVPPQYASNLWATGYTLRVGSTRNMTMHQNGVIAGGDGAPAADIYPLGSWSANAAVPVLPGQKICFSAYLNAHRCAVGVGVEFFDASGANTVGGTLAVDQIATPEGPCETLEQFKRVHIAAVAPAGAACVRPFMRKHNTRAGATESWFWWAAPQLEVIGADATGPSPYRPGPASSTRQLGFTGDLNATFGATIGQNLSGVFSQSSWDVVMNGQAFIRAAHIQQLTSANLTIGAISGTLNGGANPYQARIEASLNTMTWYRANGSRAVVISAG